MYVYGLLTDIYETNSAWTKSAQTVLIRSRLRWFFVCIFYNALRVHWKSWKQSLPVKNRSFKATVSYTAEETYPKISVIWRFSSCFMPWEYNRIPESQNAQAVFLPARFGGSYFAMRTPSAGLAVGVVNRAERLTTLFVALYKPLTTETAFFSLN